MMGIQDRRRIEWMAAVILVAVAVACAPAPDVDDSQLGLSKESVFATPDPIVAVNESGEPGENELMDAYFSGSPPLIPHQVEEFMPIRLSENLCLDCHDLPDMIGEALEAGDPTPMPASHYTDLRRNPGEVTQKLIGARYVCSQCHAAQTNAPPLVANTTGT